MKKITLLCLKRDRSDTLETLRNMGVLHLEYIREPRGAGLEEARAAYEKAESALNILEPYTRNNTKTQDTGLEEFPEASELAEKVHDLADNRKKTAARLESLEKERRPLLPYGDFKPEAVRRLAGKGIIARLFRDEPHSSEPAPEGALLFELSRGSSGRYVAVIGTRDFDFPAAEFPLPERALSDIDGEISQLNDKLQKLDLELKDTARARDRVDNLKTELYDELRYAEAKESMGEAGDITWLEGFCPRDTVPALKDKASSIGWGLLVDDPSPDDRVPTLVQSPAWVRPVEPVLKFIDLLPGYREIDISSVFLIAFSIFFAMIVGDAGYGFVFLLMTAALKHFMKHLPRHAFQLLGILSVCTVAWGVATGTYFGFSPPRLRFLQISWIAEGNAIHDENFMTLCFFIGAVHLTVAHAWNGLRMINSTRALAQVGWICITWAMYFLAGNLVFSKPLGPAFRPLLICGLIMVPVFMTPWRRLKTEWMGHVTLPFDVISSFVDLVSYVRLFAVGSASVAVAMAANELAMGNGVNSWLAGLMAALILFVGHAINIILCLMSVLVHDVRLNTLEFSGHIGVNWTGLPYSPFTLSVPGRNGNKQQHES
ncbi:MAG: hypothetical protein R6V03_06090 [Kiritimatiellia bacterium]